MQQQVGGLHSQVDALQAELYEADAKEQMLQAKLENAQHEVGNRYISPEILKKHICHVTSYFLIQNLLYSRRLKRDSINGTDRITAS